MISYFTSVQRLGRGVQTLRGEAIASCFTCGCTLTIGPARRRGFCTECWERSRLAGDDIELGGEG